MDWKRTKLKDLGWLRSAGVNKLSDSNQKEVQLLNYMDVYRNQKITNKINFQIVTAKDSEIKNANLEVGDILFTPSSEKPTDIGHAGIVIENLPNTVYSYHLVRFRPYNPELFNPHFLAYALNSFNSEKHFISRATGTTRYTLSKSDFKSLEFEYPENPNEQTAIATMLSKVDETIEVTKNSIKAAEKLKKALMQNLLTGKLKPDGTWRTEDEFYEDEKFGKVPVGWEVKSIKQLFDFYPTSSYSRSKLIDYGEIGYIHYGDIHTKFDRILDLSIESVSFIPNELEKKYEKLKDGDLVVSDASEDWDGVGKSIEIINSDSKKVIAGLHTLHLRPKSADLILGIKGYIMNLHQVSTSIKRMATGAKVYGVSKSSLSKILLPIPTEPEQQAIKKKLDKVSNETSQKQTKINKLQRLKKALMQNLLTGKVRLPSTFIAQFKNEREVTNTTTRTQ